MSAWVIMTETQDMENHDTASVALVAPVAIAVPSDTVGHAHARILPAHKRWTGFDDFLARARDATPMNIVNNGTRLCLSFKAAADGLSIWSALRKTSRSPWRLVASSISLGSEMLGMQFPERQISQEQAEKYKHMSKFDYVISKTREAFDPKHHISETAGLSLILNGACMAMSGYSQSVRSRISWEITQGLMTASAGAMMLYIPDRERAWQLADATFIVRSVPAALQAKNAYFVGVPELGVAPGDWQQGGKWVLNQVANALGTLYGGVKKMPDGSIVHLGKKGEDISAPRQSRQQLASHIVAGVPAMSISQPEQQGKVVQARLMPHLEH